MPRNQASSEVSLQEVEYLSDLLLLAVIRSDHSGKLLTITQGRAVNSGAAMPSTTSLQDVVVNEALG